MNRVSTVLWLSLIATLSMPCCDATAQQYPSVDGRQFPLNQMTPPGTAAQWAANLGRTTPEYFQPVRVALPTEGVVTFFEGTPDRAYDLAAPAQASLVVGSMYRLRISGMPEFPGVDFFPSIELIDRLHPPAGKVEDFPVEFELTLEELEWAAAGRLMTKVVYLEQPDRVPVTILESKERITTIEPSRNAIAEADLLGRPVAIVRLGGRTPDPNQPEPAFFGPGGPIRVTVNSASTEIQREKRDQANRQSSPSARTNRTTQVQPVDEKTVVTERPGVVRLNKSATRRVAQR